METDKFALACVVAWNIWNFRNGKVHDSEVGERETVVGGSKAFLESYKSGRFNFPMDGTPHSPICWQPPSRPMIKINFDAAVARDSEGKCIGWEVWKFRGSPSQEIAEAIAARHAMLMARRGLLGRNQCT